MTRVPEGHSECQREFTSKRRPKQKNVTVLMKPGNYTMSGERRGSPPRQVPSMGETLVPLRSTKTETANVERVMRRETADSLASDDDVANLKSRIKALEITVESKKDAAASHSRYCTLIHHI